MQAGIAWCVWNLATRNWDDALETLEEFGGKESHVITFHACCVALGALREIGGDVWGSLVRTYAKVLLNECGFEATTDRFVIGCRALVATCLLELNELDMGRLTATLERDEETISARASSTDRFLARRIRMTRQELRKRLGQK
jgi:hypothetical protein